MRILFISIHYPSNLSTNTQGIYKRMGMFVDAIKVFEQIDMLFFVPPDTDVSTEAIATQERAFSEYWQTQITLHLCPTIPQQKLIPKWRKQLNGIFSFFEQFPASPEQIKALEICLAKTPDAVFVHRISSISVLIQANLPLPPVFFDLDDIEHIRFIREIQQPPSELITQLYLLQVPARWWGELQAIRLARRTFVCSEQDRRYLTNRWGLTGIVTIPNAVSIPEVQPITKEPTLFLIGGYYYYPNTNAANFLIEKVWADVHSNMPNARLIIAGSEPHHIRSYDKGVPGVEFAGFVDDLDAIYQRARVVCCPIFSGGGTRVKMIEAAAYGKPIVATRLGAEGIALINGKEFLMADRPKDFVNACLELLQNDDLCNRLGTAARAAAIQHYDRVEIVQQIKDKIQLEMRNIQTGSSHQSN